MKKYKNNESFSLKDEFYKRLDLIRESKKISLKQIIFERFIYKLIPKKLKKF